LISDGERNSYIKILLEAIELPPLKILSESTINLILRLYRKVINVIVGKSCHQNEKGQATGKPAALVLLCHQLGELLQHL